jgi:predicted amidophosphoribosyltransferase
LWYLIGKDILLIDDIYTKTVNIDEDAIQALLSKGAKSVSFYAIGFTVSKY